MPLGIPAPSTVSRRGKDFMERIYARLVAGCRSQPSAAEEAVLDPPEVAGDRPRSSNAAGGRPPSSVIAGDSSVHRTADGVGHSSDSGSSTSFLGLSRSLSVASCL